MSRHVGVILFLVTLFSLSLANPDSGSEETKFSKLLNKKSDLFRYTSILNSPKPESSEFHRVYSKDEESAFANRQGLSEPRVITRPEPGEEFVRIHQSIRNSNEKSNEKSNEDAGSVTNINQKPIYGRTPVALLRQGSGNRLNISPVFPNHWEPVNRIARFDNFSEEVPHQGEVTTVSPNYDESSEGTTANYEDTEETAEVDPTDFPVQPDATPEKKMIVNVVTSAPRVVFDNVTAIRKLPTKPDSDNFVLDSRRRQTQFPDFEDTPVNLAVAESHQPARVNVRPANSGNAYEYEYIYYYYDDEDDDNSTTGKTEEKDQTDTQTRVAESPIQTQQVEPQTQTFVNTPSISISDTESVQLPDPSNHLVEKTRQEKTFVPQLNMEDEEIPAATIDDIPIQTTIQPEIFTKRPFVNKPFVIKQSNLPQQEGPVATAAPPAPTTRATTTTLKYVDPDVTTSRLLGQRFRQKTRNDFQHVTQNQLPLSPEPTSPSVTLDTTRRNPFKDSNRLRNQGNRRVPQALEPEIEQNRVASPTFETAPSIKSEVVEEEVRFPARTRFPPRTHATATTPLLTSPYVSLEPASTVLTPTTIDPAVDKKAKDNFARQKSINDLYALTRLHQLAINNRVPNRKVLEAKAKATSAEATTKYPDDASSSESATISATTPTNQLNQVNVEISRIPVTTQDISSAAPTSALPSSTTTTEYSKFGRGRPGRRRPSPAPTTTTEGAPPSRITHPNRFGRRRSTSTTPTPEAFQSDAPVSPVSSPAAHEEESQPPRRNPARSRFANRNRFSSSTTTEANGEESERPASLASSAAPSEQPTRRRPNNFPRRRFNNHQVNPSVSASTDEAVASPSPNSQTEAPTRQTSTSEDRTDRRKFNFARNRPSVGPVTGPQIGANRQQRVRFQTSTTTSEAPQPHVEEIEGPEASPTLQTEQIEKVEAPVATSFSQSSSVVEQPIQKGRGSAGVLGRLRNRAKVTPSTTTVAPDPAVADKKPSRLTGILNRRKVTPAPPASSHAPEEVEETHNNGGEQDDVQRKEVIIQVSSTVTESEEVGEAVDAPSSTTTHTSILSRLKSQRKPGSIFSRKKPENPSE